MAEYAAQDITDVVIYPVGRKVAERVQKSGWQSAGDFSALADKPNSHDCAVVSEAITRKYMAHEIDKVELIYHHFKSAGSQILTRRTFLPIDLSTEKIGAMNDRDLTSNVATAKAQEYLRQRDRQRQHVAKEAKPLNDNFLVEPNLEYVLRSLVPKLLNTMVYTALLDSIASEHAARMVAMQTATDNADEPATHPALAVQQGPWGCHYQRTARHRGWLGQQLVHPSPSYRQPLTPKPALPTNGVRASVF